MKEQCIARNSRTAATKYPARVPDDDNHGALRTTDGLGNPKPLRYQPKMHPSMHDHVCAQGHRQTDGDLG